jgi:DNA-directed RNA polymerase specialized sigma24 family protein
LRDEKLVLAAQNQRPPHSLPSEPYDLGLGRSISHLWERHREAVYRRCLSLLRGHEGDGEEAYSRVAILVVQAFPHKVDDLANPKAWLFTIAHNVCMDLHRERKRGREVSLEALADLEARHPPFSPATREDPEGRYLEGEQTRCVLAACRRPVRRGR